MTFTQTQICNLALAKLGDVARVTSVDPPDGSMQAAYCALFYPQALQVLAAKHAWSFCKISVALTPNPTCSNPLWDYAYALPSDYFALLEVGSVPTLPGPVSNGQYRPMIPLDLDAWIAYDIEAGTLYSNYDSAILVYISSAYLLESLFPPLFVEALAVLLSSYLAGPILKGDVGAAAQKAQLQQFTFALNLAVEADSKTRRSAKSPLIRPASGITARA